MPRINLLVLCVVRRVSSLPLLLCFLLCNCFLVSDIGEVQVFIQVFSIALVQGANKKAIALINIVLSTLQQQSCTI